MYADGSRLDHVELGRERGDLVAHFGSESARRGGWRAHAKWSRARPEWIVATAHVGGRKMAAWIAAFPQS